MQVSIESPACWAQAVSIGDDKKETLLALFWTAVSFSLSYPTHMWHTLATETTTTINKYVAHSTRPIYWQLSLCPLRHTREKPHATHLSPLHTHDIQCPLHTRTLTSHLSQPPTSHHHHPLHHRHNIIINNNDRHDARTNLTVHHPSQRQLLRRRHHQSLQSLRQQIQDFGATISYRRLKCPYCTSSVEKFVQTRVDIWGWWWSEGLIVCVRVCVRICTRVGKERKGRDGVTFFSSWTWKERKDDDISRAWLGRRKEKKKKIFRPRLDLLRLEGRKLPPPRMEVCIPYLNSAPLYLLFLCLFVLTLMRAIWATNSCLIPPPPPPSPLLLLLLQAFRTAAEASFWTFFLGNGEERRNG